MRDRALKKDEAAQLLGHSVSTLADPRWRQRVGLRATRVGRSLRFLESDVQSLLRRGREHHQGVQEGLQ